MGDSLTAEWERMWRDPAVISKSVRFRVIHVKLLLKVYVTPSRLKKVDPLIPAGIVVDKWEL